ncbi:hypothetical protein NDU88_005669 [Pleurodeles waltl]|uniref:Uncharacterized protein n=1 Tax=Pleurodeles waltl TaxID=8319 RepID=A0AAV7WYB6_PLEWA|nr:hypothetical protein NDU88_005669 [Pleurodeles waltl]
MGSGQRCDLGGATAGGGGPLSPPRSPWRPWKPVDGVRNGCRETLGVLGRCCTEAHFTVASCTSRSSFGYAAALLLLLDVAVKGWGRVRQR